MFGIFKIYRDVKKGIASPTGFGKELALDVIKGPLVLVTFLGGLVLALVFIAGFTGLFGGPYLVGRIFFFVGLVPFFLFELIAWTVYRKIERLLESARKRAATVIETRPE